MYTPYQELTELIEEINLSQKTNRLRCTYWKAMTLEHFRSCCAYECRPDGSPYPWQVEFHNASADSAMRAIIASNQSGKTLTCAADLAIHATGLYPPWWEGERINRGIQACIGSKTNEMLRDIQQKYLYGGYLPESSMPDGTGWVPKDCIVSVKSRQCGIPGVFDTVEVRHVSGEISVIKGKTYEQGWTTWQGVAYDYLWLDEEPEDDMIFSEVLRGMLSKSGRLVLSRTPLYGMTNMIKHFLESDSKSTYYINVTIDDSPHIEKKAKEAFIAGLQDHEIETRTKGIVMLGEGAIYPIDDRHISYESFSIPKHFRKIVGLDFGVDHPTAACWLAHDPDTDIIYIYDAYRKRRETVANHASAIHARGDSIPVAWPHDGMHADKSGSGKNLSDMYREHYVNMLHVSARYDDKKGGGQAREPIIQECYERMVSGRLKVASHLSMWFEEKRMYHRKNGKVVDVQDDLISAMHYGVMMIRYARSDYTKEYQSRAINNKEHMAITSRY